MIVQRKLKPRSAS